MLFKKPGVDNAIGMITKGIAQLDKALSHNDKIADKADKKILAANVRAANVASSQSVVRENALIERDRASRIKSKLEELVS